MYRFYDDETENIIKKNNITEYVILFENRDFLDYERGLDKLCYHTCKILEELKTLDDYGTFLISESIRFLVCVYNFQRYPNKLHGNYYSKILSKFHNLGYLKFKDEVKPYKLYKKKKYTFKINYTLNKEEVEMIYYSLKNMQIDYGRYRVDKITSLYPKQSVLNYNFINTIGVDN